MTGAVLGFMGGGGLAVAISRIPLLRRHTLEDRVGPYLRDPPRPPRLMAEPPTLTPFPTLERLLRPAARTAARVIEHARGGAVTARRRLEYAGSALSVEQFRFEQLCWAAVGMLGGILVSVLLLAEGRQRHPGVLGMLVLVAACAGLVARDLALTRQYDSEAAGSSRSCRPSLSSLLCPSQPGRASLARSTGWPGWVVVSSSPSCAARSPRPVLAHR